MHARLDAVAVVGEMYSTQPGPVPYLVFMQLFNELLSDPRAVTPMEPCEELQERFRAACMAVSMGVTDEEGRADERVQEFQSRILPIWREKLGPVDFRQYEDILRGMSLRRRKALQEEERGSSQIIAANEKSNALLRRLRLIDGEGDPVTDDDSASVIFVAEVDAPDETEPGEGPEAVAVPPPPATVPAAAAEQEGAPVFESMSAMCRSIRQGLLAPEPGEKDGAGFASYRVGVRSVSARRAHVSGKDYAVLVADIGYSSLAGGLEEMDVIAAAMGYKKMASGAYMRKSEEYIQTLKAKADKVSVASAQTGDAPPADLPSQLTTLHWDIGELLERMGA